MEIELKNISFQSLDKVSIKLRSNKIIGVYGKKKGQLFELLSNNMEYKGTIIIDGKKLTKKTVSTVRNRISYIKKNSLEDRQSMTVEELFRFTIFKKKISIKDIDKKVSDALKIVGLDESYLQRQYGELSLGEAKLVLLSKAMLENPTIIIVDELFAGIDGNIKKYLLKLFEKLKTKYNKTIILGSMDVDFLYQNTEDCILLDNIVASGNTTDIFQNVPFLIENDIEIPKLSLFTYLTVKDKQTRLSYHKDIRDLIKDIYKHIDFTKNK